MFISWNGSYVNSQLSCSEDFFRKGQLWLFFGCVIRRHRWLLLEYQCQEFCTPCFWTVLASIFTVLMFSCVLCLSISEALCAQKPRSCRDVWFCLAWFWIVRQAASSLLQHVFLQRAFKGWRQVQLQEGQKVSDSMWALRLMPLCDCQLNNNLWTKALKLSYLLNCFVCH